MSKADKNSGYMGNPNLPTNDSKFEYSQEQISEIVKCQENILHFAENYFYILNLDEGKQKIKLYAAQKRVLRKLKNNRFLSLLASRQIGKTTIFTIYILWLANFFPDQKILLVANKEGTAIEIFQRVRMAYEMLPNWLKNPIDKNLGGWGKTAMGLMNGSSVAISTTTGTAGRGQAISCLIIDECAFIETHLMDPFWASVFPIVSSSKKSKVFMCSTANGTGNLFYNIYMGAVEGTNNWAHEKILWNEVPGRTDTWMKDTKGGLASEEKWQQEFECKFLNSGTSSMSEELYNRLSADIKPPIEILMDGKYKLWAHPDKGRRYVAGIDTAEGIGGDFSCIKILDITDLNEIEEVAEYYDNFIPVAEFANRCYEILSHWGQPLAAVERNNQGGQVADRLGLDFGYEKLICWGGKLAGRKSQELLGMVSSRNTKIRAVGNARYFYSERGSVIFRNSDSLQEVYKYFIKQPNDTWSAISGQHDDRTMALIWALMVLDKEVCEDFFTIEKYDDCGKPEIIVAHDSIQLFDRSTSIYTNEEVATIESSWLSPVAFGSVGHEIEEIDNLLKDGWQFLGGTPYQNPDQTWNDDQWKSYEKLDLNRYFG